MSTSKFECQKFSPNIFNKSKCQHCFRSKDQHSAEALECNRVSRKISKCGYLFVAPDWDFSVPMNRTKRWQRRWFVLYEDGELTYSVDEHPDTIPQAIVEMTKVVEVSDAEDVTGNKFAVAITAPDKIYYIKGTCKEESKWWFDVLVMYPRSLKGRQKRNATFPCIKATGNTAKARVVDGQGNWGESGAPRFRYLSCHTEPNSIGYDQIDVGLKNAQNSGIKPLMELEERTTICEKSKIEDNIPRDIEIILADNSRRSRVDSHYSKRCQKRDGRKHEAHRSRSLGAPVPNSSSTEDLNEALPATASDTPSHLRVSSPLYARLSDVPKMKRYDSLESLQQDQHGPLSPRAWYQGEEGEENNRNHPNVAAPSHDQPQRVGKSNRLPYAPLRETKKTSQSTSGGTKMPFVPHDPMPYPSSNSLDFGGKKDADKDGDKDGDNTWREHTIRGDPDGCGLDHIVRCPSSIPEIRVDPMDLYSENILNFKKGWLMRQEVNKEWCKRWCILYGSSLKVYQDLKAEDSGNLDSIISMNLVQHVEEVDVGRNYGFKIKMADNKCHIFSAVTAGIRSNWVYALKNAANVREVEDVVSMGERIEREIPHMNKLDSKVRTASESTAIKQRSAMSRTPSSFSLVEELRLIPGAQAETPCARVPEGDCAPIGAPSSNSRTLPPSPPLNRTAISKVKERARLKTNVKVSPKSSPTLAGEGESEDADKAYWSRPERQETAERVANPTKMEAHGDAKELGRPSMRNARTKDRSRRYTLPGKNSLVVGSEDVAPSTKSPSRTTTRPNKDKDMKWHGDHHCSSLFERNRLIEALQTRLQRSENKIHDLENEMEVLCKSHAPSDAETAQREDAKMGLKAGAVISARKASVKGSESYQDEIKNLKEALDTANGELIDVVNRLQKATDENESLRKSFTAELGSSKKLPRVGSLSDLTTLPEEVDVDSTSREALAEKYKELRARFEKAVNEIKALKKELKEAYGKCDELEVLCMNQKHHLSALEADYKGQIGLMSVRIEDLTAKFSNSEKQLRHQMKQRPAGKEQRRTRSLKGREALTVSKEVENKVEELEKKLLLVEGLLKNPDEEGTEGETEAKKVEGGPTEADKQVHVFVRLNALEAKVHGVSHRAQSLSSSRTSLATEALDDTETDEASLFTKSEGCPSDYETSDKDAPVTLISELNGQIQGLRSRAFELELSLRGCRQKVEQCKDVVDALGGSAHKSDQIRLVGEHLKDAVRWLDGSGASFGLVLKDFFPDVLHRLNELVLGKAQGFSQPEASGRNLLSERRAYRSSILNSLSRALCLTPAKPDCPHRCLLEAARRLCGSMHVLTARLDPTAVSQVAVLDEAPRMKDDATELLERSLCTLAKNMAAIQNLAAPWKEEHMLMLIGACLDEVKDCPYEFDGLPTVVLLREVFSRAQAESLRAMAEAEVVDVVARLLHGGESAALAWIQKTEEQKTRTVAEHLALEVDNVFHVLKSGVAAAARNPEKGCRRRLDGAVLREYAEVVTQAAFACGSLAALRALTAAGPDCPGGEYCTFCEVQLELASPPSGRCPPPRVVGEVVKVGHCATGVATSHYAAEAGKESMGSWALKMPQEVVHKEWRRDGATFGAPQDGCQQCKELHRKVQQMAEKYASDLLFETERHQAKLEAVYQEQALKLASLETNHADQAEKSQKEILVLNEKLSSLEEDYESQILSLKEMFEQEISKRTNIKINKANVQRKYRAEIEQLKTLCEKGLLAMEHSNKRIIAELEEKHRRELEQLQLEKEQALAEETQATLAALDAMRKAHEAELQREVARFKEEFLQKMDHSSADLDALHQEHEEEMESIKHEILALSSKYSVKCLECAALEEHLEVMTQKLTEANSIIFELTARNKQLRTHLKQNIRGLSTMVKNRNQHDKETMKDLQLSLQLKESQLAEKEEEIADLNFKLTATKNHENELENHCRSLDASLNADTKACEDDMGTLRARLEHIILANQPSFEGHKEQERLQTCHHMSETKSKRSNGSSSSTSRGPGAELIRSPSCPGLSLPDGKVGRAGQKPGTSASGVVASRKKMFEYPDGQRS